MNDFIELDLRDYNDWAKTKRRPSEDALEAWYNASEGFYGETGELVDHLKKVTWHGHDIDKTLILKECGDIIFYTVWLLDIVDEVAPSKQFDMRRIEINFRPMNHISIRALEGRLAHVNAKCYEVFEVHDITRSYYAALETALLVVAVIADRYLGMSLNWVMKHNKDKLNERYPSGFSEEASRNRSS